jgi:hypothetical protein
VRTEILRLSCVLVLGACASVPRTPSPARGTVSTPAPRCAAAGADARGAEACELPADVRAFVEDRELCDHLRGEPWPEGDTDADRMRRRELVEGVRMACAGTDRRLAELKARYAADARIATLLGRFDPAVGD